MCSLRQKTRRLMPVAWKPTQTLLKLKMKISRTLWTRACAFSPGLPALKLDYTPYVPPLLPLKYGSDDRKGQQPVWGRPLAGRWMRGVKRCVWGGREGDTVHHSEPSVSFRGPVMDCIHIEKGLWRSVFFFFFFKRWTLNISSTSVCLNGPVDP